jgi:hypothetical protein
MNNFFYYLLRLLDLLYVRMYSNKGKLEFSGILVIVRYRISLACDAGDAPTRKQGDCPLLGRF